jgi:hypothetical protein
MPRLRSASYFLGLFIDANSFPGTALFPLCA